MTPPSRIRTLLVLGRISNVPTVWSNCLAGWLLGGGGDLIRGADWMLFAVLCAGATLLYIGGMYLNDAFDAEFDSQHRRERPIPSGAITEKTVWRVGITLLVIGTVCLVALGITTGILALLLCTCIVVYDVVHKIFTVSPVLMALCRVLLYLVAASAAASGITGLAAWGALALGIYVIGLSYVARKEALGVKIEAWPQFLLAVPVLLSLLVNDGPFRQPALIIAAIVSLWIIRSLRSLWVAPHHVGRAVSGLLAGIVWVDLLAVADEPRLFGAVFVALFLLAIGFQRFVPAT
ncbi:MAG TPA: UbiA family prenyltransferase [Methylomirabilota bacterium]|nr:UbiA family prenyltransferase [Methylomirabilota bacterium]